MDITPSLSRMVWNAHRDECLALECNAAIDTARTPADQARAEQQCHAFAAASLAWDALANSILAARGH